MGFEPMSSRLDILTKQGDLAQDREKSLETFLYHLSTQIIPFYFCRSAV